MFAWGRDGAVSNVQGTLESEPIECAGLPGHELVVISNDAGLFGWRMTASWSGATSTPGPLMRTAGDRRFAGGSAVSSRSTLTTHSEKHLAPQLTGRT